MAACPVTLQLTISALALACDIAHRNGGSVFAVHVIVVRRQLPIDDPMVPESKRNDPAVKAVQAAIDRSLRRMNVEALDLIQFHWWDYAVPGCLDTAGWLAELQREKRVADALVKIAEQAGETLALTEVMSRLSRLTVELTRDATQVRIAYRTAPSASALPWLEPSLTAGKAQPFVFTPSAAIHARRRATLVGRAAVPSEFSQPASENEDTMKKQTKITNEITKEDPTKAKLPGLRGTVRRPSQEALEQVVGGDQCTETGDGGAMGCRANAF